MRHAKADETEGMRSCVCAGSQDPPVDDAKDDSIEYKTPLAVRVKLGIRQAVGQSCRGSHNWWYHVPTACLSTRGEIPRYQSIS